MTRCLNHKLDLFDMQPKTNFAGGSQVKLIVMKSIVHVVVSIIMLVAVISCGSSTSFEDDVKKMANYQCEIKKLLAKDQSDKEVQKQETALQKEMEEFAVRMGKKYADKKVDTEKEAKIMKDILDKCK